MLPLIRVEALVATRFLLVGTNSAKTASGPGKEYGKSKGGEALPLMLCVKRGPSRKESQSGEAKRGLRAFRGSVGGERSSSGVSDAKGISGTARALLLATAALTRCTEAEFSSPMRGKS